MVVHTVKVNGLKASVEKVRVLGQEEYAVSVPFDITGRTLTFKTEAAAKAALTRYIKLYNKGQL